jgi:cyanophycin synthetase
MSAERIAEFPSSGTRPAEFTEWRSRLDRDRIAPVIAIAGSRGKTSVLRAVESILRAGHYRFASWTDRGVEIEGARQRGELGPWSRALTRLAAGGLDVALQEIDWATFQAIGTPGSDFPVAAVTNLCANSEACLITPETVAARKTLTRVQSSVAGSGRLILNADDFAVSEANQVSLASRYLVGISPDTPMLRRHLLAGGDAAWIANDTIVTSEDHDTATVAQLGDLDWTRDGEIQFATQNALIATAIARSCGLSRELIAAGLSSHVPRPESMPGSFNVYSAGAATVVVDRPMPSWFLRTSLRATANLGSGRQIRVVGPMVEIATDDLHEIGRLLGRSGGVLIFHGAWTAERLDRLRQGAAANDVPPIALQTEDERTGVQQGLAMLRAGDVMLVLAEDAPAVVRLLDRRLRRRTAASRSSVGAA